MTAKEFVLEHLPKAVIEKQKANGKFGKTYYLIREYRKSYMWLASGQTVSKAWTSAKQVVQERLNNEQTVQVSDTTILNKDQKPENKE